MPTEEQQTVTKNSKETTTTTTPSTTENLSSEAIVEQERSEKILKAKELYSHGSRNFLVKSFAEAADELSQVCALYEELHGELSDELGMPYLLYAKSLIALALDENKVIDVPDEEEDDDEEDEEENAEAVAEATNGKSPTNGTKLDSIKEDAEVDSTAAAAAADKEADKNKKEGEEDEEEQASKQAKPEKLQEVSEVSSTANDKAKQDMEQQKEKEEKKSSNGDANGKEEKPQTSSIAVDDGEKPSTSNGEAAIEEDDEDNEAASNLQLAWEILELAAKIFSRQGERGLANLAEVQTELANIEFENNILEAARDDYEKALTIYKELPNNYRRAMAEIHYKIGLTFLMQQQNKEGANSLKEACNLIAGEIDEIKKATELSEKEKNNIQDMEETKQEIEAKIIEIEETQAQNIAEVRAALDSYIKPLSSGDVDAGSSKSATAALAASTLTADATLLSSSSSSSASTAAITSSSKPTDISHLIKRKKPEDPSSEAEAAVACSPAKRPAV